MVKIHDLINGKVYTAHSEKDCRCTLSKSIYRMVKQYGAVSVGQMVGQPIKA